MDVFTLIGEFMTNYNYNYSRAFTALETTDDNFRRALALDSSVDISSVTADNKSKVCSAWRFPAAIAEAFGLDIDNPSQVRRVCRTNYSLCYWVMKHPASQRWYFYDTNFNFHESDADYSTWEMTDPSGTDTASLGLINPFVGGFNVGAGTKVRCMTDLTNGIVILLYNSYTIQTDNSSYASYAPCVITGFNNLNGLLGSRLAIIRPNIAGGSNSSGNYGNKSAYNSGIILDNITNTKYTSFNIKCFWSEQRYHYYNSLSDYENYAAQYNTNSSTNLIVSPFCVETAGARDAFSTNSIGFGVIPTSVVGRTPTVGLSLPMGYQFMQGRYVHLGDGYIVKWDRLNGPLW